MSQITLKGIPTLRILDYDQAVDFKVKCLGFNIDWEHWYEPNAPVHMQISKDGLTLHLSENERFKAGIITFVECKGLNELYSDLLSRESNIELTKPEETNWQTIQMEIEDPFGNLLRFNEAIVE